MKLSEILIGIGVVCFLGGGVCAAINGELADTGSEHEVLRDYRVLMKGMPESLAQTIESNWLDTGAIFATHEDCPLVSTKTGETMYDGTLFTFTCTESVFNRHKHNLTYYAENDIWM